MFEFLRPRDHFNQAPIPVDPYTLAMQLDSLVRSYGDKPSETLLADPEQGFRIEGIMQGLRSALEPTTDWEGHPAVRVVNEEDLRSLLKMGEEVEAEGEGEMTPDKEFVFRTLIGGTSEMRMALVRGKIEALRWVLGIQPEQAATTQTA